MDIERNMQEKGIEQNVIIQSFDFRTLQYLHSQHPSPPSSSASSSYSCGSDKRIFLVDDESDQTLSFKIGLENSGFKVDAFNDPIEALSNFKTGTYDLLLLDVRMPKMNGFELYDELRKLDNNVKICFLTAAKEIHYEAMIKEAFPELDVNYFLKKPIANEDLIKQVSELLELK